MAYNMSHTAYGTGKKARAVQEDMFTKLTEMSNNAMIAMQLAQLTSNNVELAMNITQATLMEAKSVLDEANRNISDIGIQVIRGKEFSC